MCGDATPQASSISNNEVASDDENLHTKRALTSKLRQLSMQASIHFMIEQLGSFSFKLPVAKSHEPCTIGHEPTSIKHQASSIKYQAASIKHEESSIQHQATKLSVVACWAIGQLFRNV